ncbi:BTB/POZ domain-containing protein At5g03250-like [Sesamum indicum]|uniref:BTB/POZ domain-containing protein At5g03250-like n=1 Tax=Sesamum indicum TaxID=4182 RepID=A0A6I9T0W8_SESIN|nr:BTB/POZ domain-containing protein At5g03250-like [Sesamum indicum]
MDCMKLGCKADVFHMEGQSWLCTSGLPSDVCIEVGEMSFHLHKFPLSSRSQLLEKLIQEFSASQENEEETKCVLSLHDLPGGATSLLLIAKFCYGVKFEITAAEVVSLRCGAEYLQMTEDYGEGNLILVTEVFLDNVLRSWVDTIKALETCEAVLPLSEELHIISRCIDSLATKACAGPTLSSLPMSCLSAAQSPTAPWNGIHSTSKPCPKTEDCWYKDVATLELPLFKRLVLAVGYKGMTSDRIAGSIMFYATRYLPLNGRQSSFPQRNPGSRIPIMSDADQRTLIEEIIRLLPNQMGATPTNFLLRLLRTSMILQASPTSRETLERRIGAQLDEAVLQDLLIPNTGYSVETLYDIECVQRIVSHFLFVNREDHDSNFNSVVEEDQLADSYHSLTPMTMVANLLDKYLAEVAPDVNLKLDKFLLLAATIPDYARPTDDGIYRAIDIYLKAHPWLTDSEREQLCRLMNCQKLSLEASSHAAQNQRLPLRVIIQVLFYEQLRLRTSVAGWFFVSDNLENSQNLSGSIGQTEDRAIPVNSKRGQISTLNDMQERVSGLEKECENMKHEIEKLVKTKGSWSNFRKRFGLRFKSKSFDFKSTMLPCNGEALQPSSKAVLDKKQDHDQSKLAN